MGVRTFSQSPEEGGHCGELWSENGQALTWMAPVPLQLPVNMGLTGRGEKRQGHVKLWGPATVRQSTQAGEGDQRIE